MLRPLHGSLDDKLQQLADMVQVVADGEADARRRVVELRRSTGYVAAYADPEPLVSVVIATYTSFETLRDIAIPSALSQTHGNVEVVVAGDQAPPETAEVIRRIDDPRVRFENLPMRGPYPDDPERGWLCSGTLPYNAAVAMARGSWIAPLGDDDAFLPDHVERLLAAARERRLELVYGKLLAHMPGGEQVLVGDFPPRIGEFGLQGALYHAGLQFLGLELSDATFDVPNDWSLCRRMMRAGVRIGMVDAIVTDYYPSVEWGRRQRPDVSPPVDEQAQAELAEARALAQVQAELAEARALEQAQALAQVQAELAQAQALAQEQAELERTRADLARATGQIAALQAQLQELQRRHDVIASSSSWRFTRPLRDAAALLRRG